MYLKKNPYSYRRRRRQSSIWRILVLLLLIAAGSYILFTLSEDPDAGVAIFTTPTLMPTPTRSAISYAAEGSDYYRAGQLSEAIDAYRHALDMNPDQPDLYVDLARLFILRDRPDRGLDIAREALRRDEENARAWATLCVAYDWLGMADEALSYCERAIALEPTLPEAYAYLAEAYVDLGNWFAANEQIQTALELDSNNVDVLRNYGYVLEVQGNYSGAVGAYRDALQQNPSLAHLYLAVGRNYQALGNFPQAIEAYETATESDPNSVAALDRLGWTYLLQGDYVEAQGYLEQALEVDPNYSPALGHLGSLYFQRRNYEDAIPTLEQAIRYGEGASRLRAVRFRVTLEPLGLPVTEPEGRGVAQGIFVHPDQINYPMRAMLAGEETFSTVQGYVRFHPLDGRYVLHLEGLPPSPPNEIYVGWFEPLLTPEKQTVRTESLVPDTEGNLEISGTTGAVTGPPIENYYTVALCYYFLDRCEEAYPHIEVALRIDPEDANALQTLQLCGQ